MNTPYFFYSFDSFCKIKVWPSLPLTPSLKHCSIPMLAMMYSFWVCKEACRRWNFAVMVRRFTKKELLLWSITYCPLSNRWSIKNNVAEVVITFHNAHVLGCSIPLRTNAPKYDLYCRSHSHHWSTDLKEDVSHEAQGKWKVSLGSRWIMSHSLEESAVYWGE